MSQHDEPEFAYDVVLLVPVKLRAPSWVQAMEKANIVAMELSYRVENIAELVGIGLRRRTRGRGNANSPQAKVKLIPTQDFDTED